MSASQSKSGIFEKLDIFGTPITIRFNDMDFHKTFIGAFATIVIIGVLLVEVFYVLVDLINYNNVSVIFQEEIVSVPNQFIMNPKTFQFAIGLLSEKLNYITDEEVFYFEAVFQQTDKIFNATSNQYQFITNEVPFKMVQCSPENFQMENIKEYFLSLPYQSLYCFDSHSNLELKGQYGAQIYKRLRIRLKECEGVNCKIKEDRDKLLHDGQLQIFYVNYALQITNVTQPFQEFGQSYFWKHSKNSLKNINVYFRNTYLESTEGIIAPEVKKYNKLFYSFDREQILSQIDNTFFELYINLEKNKESHYYHKYLTLAQAFSQIGGLFNFLLSIGALFFKPISRIIYKQKLINLIFSFKKNNFEPKDNIEEPITHSPQGIPFENFYQLDDDGCKNALVSYNQFFTKNNNGTVSTQTRIGNQKFIKQGETLKLDSQIINNQLTDNALKTEFKQINNKLLQLNHDKTEKGINQSQQLQDQELTISKLAQTQQLKQFKIQQQNIQSNQKFSFNDQISSNQSKNMELSNQQIFNQALKRKYQQDTNQESKSTNKNMKDKLQKSVENYLDQLFNKSDNKFNITFSDIIKSNLSSVFKNLFSGWKMSTKSQMIQYGLQKMNQHLEINYIIDKLLELEKLKQLLLNNEQIRLFNLIPKPDINEIYFKNENSNHQLQKTHIFLAQNKNLQEKIIDAQDAFNQIINGKGELSQTNNKLLELLDPKLIIFLGQNNNYSRILSQRQTISLQKTEENKQCTTTFNLFTDKNQILEEKNMPQSDLFVNLNVAEESTFNEEFKSPRPFISSSNSKFLQQIN